jgi:hypothetical protein
MQHTGDEWASFADSCSDQALRYIRQAEGKKCQAASVAAHGSVTNTVVLVTKVFHDGQCLVLCAEFLVSFEAP